MIRFRSARAVVAIGAVFSAASLAVRAHDVSTAVTWDREISRIVFARCAPCHRTGGTAFSLLTYQEVFPWATAIKTQVLQRDMPPWGAVKGFGVFRNDQALGQEEIDLIRAWVDGGAPEGNPDHLPVRPAIPALPEVEPSAGALVAAGDYTFARPFTIDGFTVRNQPKAGSAQVTIAFPDGRVEPLVWLYRYDGRQGHPFLLRTPITAPAGASIRGLLPGASLTLLPRGGER